MSSNHHCGKRLPFVELTRVFHFGHPAPFAGAVQPATWARQWLFEPGLLPVSLDSAHWVPNAAGGDHYELSSRRFRFVVVEQTIERFSSAIARAAAARGWLAGGKLTPQGYEEALLTQGTTPNPLPRRRRTPIKKYEPAYWAALEVCLALHAREDEMIDGLWWCETNPAIAPIQRGGFFQDRLPLPIIQLPHPISPPPDPPIFMQRRQIF